MHGATIKIVNTRFIFKDKYYISDIMKSICCRGQLKCDGTRAETRFRLSTKRTSPFESVGGVSSVDYWQPRCAHQRY